MLYQPKTYGQITAKKKQMNTAIQFIQLDIQKMKRAMTALEEECPKLLSRVPSGLNKAIDNLYNQSDNQKKNYQMFNPSSIQEVIKQNEDLYEMVYNKIIQDIKDTECSSQSNTFIKSFSDNILDRLLKSTRDTDTNLTFYIDKRLDVPSTRLPENEVIDKPDLFETSVPARKLMTIPKPNSGPIGSKLSEQSSEIDKLMISYTKIKDAKQNKTIANHNPDELLLRLNNDMVSMSKLDSEISIHHIQEKLMKNLSKKYLDKQTTETFSDANDPVEVEALEVVRNEAKSLIKQLNIEHSQNKATIMNRINLLKHKLAEQEARLAAFDEMKESLLSKLAYLQFKSEDFLKISFDQRKSADLICSAMEIYTGQLSDNIDTTLENLRNNIHRIELEKPFY